MRIALVAFFLACSHAPATREPTPAAPVATASASAAPEATASTSATATASAAEPDPGTVFCESQSPPMPVDPADTRTSCWYAGTSCNGRGGDEGEHFKVAGAIVSGSFVHGGCNPGSYALVYEPSTSPLRVHVCAKRSPPSKCPAMINDGAKWDTAPLLRANGATQVTIAKP